MLANILSNTRFPTLLTIEIYQKSQILVGLTSYLMSLSHDFVVFNKIWLIVEKVLEKVLVAPLLSINSKMR